MYVPSTFFAWSPLLFFLPVVGFIILVCLVDLSGTIPSISNAWSPIRVVFSNLLEKSSEDVLRLITGARIGLKRRRSSKRSCSVGR